MTAPTAETTMPAHQPGQPSGARARWRILYDAMSTLGPGDLLRYEDMGNLLDLDFLDPKGKQTILANARRAADELQRQQQMVFRVVRGHGYEHAKPGQVLQLAHRHQSRAVAEIEAGHAKIGTIDRTQLDVTTARLIEATAMGFERQAVMMRQLDVRQTRLETAMASVAATAQTAVARIEETSDRVDANEQQISDLRRQIADIEATRGRRPHPADSLPAGIGS